MARLYPSCDLHFYPGASPVNMRLFESVQSFWTELSAVPGFSMQLLEVEPQAPPQSIVITNGTQLAPNVEGTQLALLQVRVPGFGNGNIAIRATVHRQLRRLLLPISILTLETDRSDRVLTVYGEFADAGGATSVVDITRHDYLQYSIMPLTGAPDAIASVIGGRITTGTSPGSARIIVQAVAGPAVVLIVTVVAPPTDRPILERLFTGTAMRKRRILLVSEGFVAAEKRRFQTLCRDLAARFRQVPPYDLMRESFDVFSAFVPSVERGVTLGPPIVAVNSPTSMLMIPITAENGLAPTQPGRTDVSMRDLVLRLRDPGSHNPPMTFAQASALVNSGTETLTPVTFATWELLANLPPQTRVRETAFGFMMGERHYGTSATIHPTAVPVNVRFELLREHENTRMPWFDDRRLPDLAANTDPNRAHVPQQDRFVRTLRAPDSPIGFGGVWASDGDSFGLVIYLANHDYYGGLRNKGYLGMSIGADVALSAVPSLAVPGLFDVEPVPVPLSSEAVRQGFRVRPILEIADVLAHELAHTTPFGELNDEYQGEGHAPTTPADIEDVEKRLNTQLLANARSPNGAIDPDRLRWNWPRAQAAAVVDDLHGTGQILTIVLNAENFARWPSNTVGREVFLRARRTSMLTGIPRATGLMTVQAIDRVNQTIRALVQIVDGGAEAHAIVFRHDGVLVLPVVDAARVVQTLVHPQVIAAMGAGPFAPAPGCVPNPRPAPPVIPNFRMPRDQSRLVAAYETAGTYNCGVIRASADCKMRTTITLGGRMPVDFCFVCKYAMVECIDPGSHGELDRTSYPR
ncbi:MAG: hypothetical protein ACKV2T_17735 [Kofleriaceae bacterium]